MVRSESLERPGEVGVQLGSGGQVRVSRWSATAYLVLSYVPAGVIAALLAAACALVGALHGLIAMVVLFLIGDAYIRLATRHEKIRFGGVLVSPRTQPELLALIDDVMRTAGVRRLDGVWIQAGGNAGALVGHRDWLWRRHVGLTIGLLTLAHLDQQDLRCVLAHEAGHLTDTHRLRARVSHRRSRARRALQRRRSRATAPYWRWFLGRTRTLAIDSERDADLVAVKLFGADATVAALQRVAEVSAMHAIATNEFLRPGYQHGLAPPTLWEAYEMVWHSGADLIANQIAHDLTAPDEAADTHPGLAERTHGSAYHVAPNLRGNVPMANFANIDQRTTFRLTRSQSPHALETRSWSEFLPTEDESHDPETLDDSLR
jgi:Zn-dependent protease with chaperone function